MPSDYIKCISKYLHQIPKLDPIPTGVEAKLEPKLPLKTIIFDIYGTLLVSASGDLDQANITTENLTKALRVSGYDWISNDYDDNAQKMLQLFHQTIKDQQELLKQKGHPYPEVDIIKVWELCFTYAQNANWLKIESETDIKLHTVIFEILSNSVWPMPNMYNIFKGLQKKGIAMGIVSNAQFYTPILMNYFMHDKVIEDAYVHGFDEKISIFSYKLLRSKPDVYLFESLADALFENYNIKPEEALFVGNDMLKDVWTAHQVGFKTALFAADKRSLRMRESDERVNGLQADFIINDLLQLLALI